MNHKDEEKKYAPRVILKSGYRKIHEEQIDYYKSITNNNNFSNILKMDDIENNDYTDLDNLDKKN